MKIRNIFVYLIGIFLLVGCGSAKDMTKYVDVEFNGIDTEGTAQYSIDYEKLYKDIFDFDEESGIPDEKTQSEMLALGDSFKIKLSKDSELTNGDKIKLVITVNKDKTNKIKSGEKTVEVSGLDEPIVLTNEDVQKNLVVNFNGVSGKGEAKIDNLFDEPLDTINFEFENDGELSNSDKAKIVLSKDEKKKLIENGYLVEDDFSPTFDVEGLDIVADKASDIANIEDIKRMIDEGINREYKSSDKNEYSWDKRYEITEEKMMYRPFKNEKSNSQQSFFWGSQGSDNGNLIKIFTIKRYSGGAEGKLEETSTVIYGYTDIILDDQNNANVAELTTIKEEKDDTYSLESVIKLYEGYGYIAV